MQDKRMGRSYYVSGCNKIMTYPIVSFFLGFLLDFLFGDPYFLPHPIRFIGRLIQLVEKGLRRNRNGNKNGKTEILQGIGMVVIVLISVVSIVWLLLLVSYRLHPYIGLAVEAFMTYQILAMKCLKVESMKVYECLREGHLEKARIRVSRIVGRDTQCLDEEGIIKAAIETVAENTSDGVIAPMFYLALGGPVLGFFYKAVNTMDSMVGYKNDNYMYFGRAAAKLDDFVNFIPSRISAVLMIGASFFLGKGFSTKEAFTIYKRDRKKHASPNAGQTEAVCAGALGIILGGDASYFGKMVKKPYIGEELQKVNYEDIKKANGLMYLTAFLFEALCLLFMFLIRRGV